MLRPLILQMIRTFDDSLPRIALSEQGNEHRDVYGAGITARDTLKENRAKAPIAVRAFPKALDYFSSRVAEN